ncbi:4-hydroxyphenylpyruvate dioxygenase [Fibrella aestuarina BUZ 2]|uniref:4-hydroxyphenylpyruvate dioxygenase n=1 Tax=Fibrella aestuarina BUZ 2 TaxID=1166018 RepID=I0K4X8_9BACT|nr:sugar phosphate isomerase/epimerase family protein [Fibrella aestuarina]CCG99181.1 4-hydroxyphenylpyruvate dioxygenase [Fibrella aestuarina BUZ 2]
MAHRSFSRRQALATLGTAALGTPALARSGTLPAVATSPFAPSLAPKAPFTLCLNMSTIMGHKLGFARELETAAKAGFESVEIWVNSLQEFLKTNSPSQARLRLTDLGLTAENAIGFAPWIVDDTAARQKGLDQMKREMEQLAQIGCKRVAAPPVGAQTPDAPLLDLHRVAERYHALLELGKQMGVTPQLELWGFAKNLNRLSDVLFVAAEANHPNARLLLDIYHLYKGGSGLTALPLVGKPAVEVFHVNDYPATLTPAQITDADRVFPGDGVAPIRDALAMIKNPDRPVVLSLEVFNKGYYAQPADVVAKTAYQKMRALIS